MPNLFNTLHLKNHILKNRIIMSPMCQYSAIDGFANDWHLVHYGSRAIGGVAAIIQEATAVSPEGRISYQDLGIWKDEHMNELKKIVDFIHNKEVLAGIQLAHAGRKSIFCVPWKMNEELEDSKKWQTVAPSSIPFSNQYQIPKELTKEEIESIINKFTDAALRAAKIGYDIIEIHAAHGYLIHEFLSPLSNKRTDEFGGNFENRIRILLNIINRIIDKTSNIPISLWVRISATDWVDKGWNLEESVKLSTILKDMGVEVIDVSSGGLVADAIINTRPNYQVPFASKIKQETGIITGAVGLITESSQAEKILDNKDADLIMIGRELLRNPYFALQAAHELNEDIIFPPQYERGKFHKKAIKL